jgi:hypothetical protein
VCCNLQRTPRPNWGSFSLSKVGWTRSTDWSKLLWDIGPLPDDIAGKAFVSSDTVASAYLYRHTYIDITTCLPSSGPALNSPELTGGRVCSDRLGFGTPLGIGANFIRQVFRSWRIDQKISPVYTMEGCHPIIQLCLGMWTAGTIPWFGSILEGRASKLGTIQAFL